MVPCYSPKVDLLTKLTYLQFDTAIRKLILFFCNKCFYWSIMQVKQTYLNVFYPTGSLYLIYIFSL